MRRISASLVVYGSLQPVTRELIVVLVATCDSVVVVDNSPAKTATLNLSLLENWPNLKYVSLPDNPGYGAAHNVAFRYASTSESSIHLVVNPDIVLQPDTVDEIFGYFNDPEVGLVMPRVVYPTGRRQVLARRVPSFWDVVLRLFRLSSPVGRSRYEISNDRIDMRVPIVSGCIMAFRVEAFVGVGGFDESFFMYWEDYDLSRRIAQSWSVLATKKPTVVHHHTGASRRLSRMTLVHLASTVKYFRKWGWFVDHQRSELNSIIGPYQKKTIGP